MLTHLDSDLVHDDDDDDDDVDGNDDNKCNSKVVSIVVSFYRVILCEHVL